MFKFLFTYHQVMPSYLDFVFPFGKQKHKKDFHFSGLREDALLNANQTVGGLPEIGRSAREWRLCYNLRSVEQSKINEPWSIRQAAVYQTFDLQSGRTLWIVVKGNNEIRNRVAEAGNDQSTRTTEARSQALSRVLDIHLMICDWSGENWRWYINDLEDQFHKLAGSVLAMPVERSPNQIKSLATFEPSMIGSRSRANTLLLSSPTSPTGSPCIASSQFPQQDISNLLSPVPEAEVSIAQDTTQQILQKSTRVSNGESAQFCKFVQQIDNGVG